MTEPTTETRTCRSCQCTDESACPGGCSWVTEDLCSSCARAQGVIPADDFGVGVMVCPCGMRMVPVLGPITVSELEKLARPTIVGPRDDSPLRANAQVQLERLHAAAAHYTGMGAADDLAPQQFEAWACPSCRRLAHLEIYLPAADLAATTHHRD